MIFPKSELSLILRGGKGELRFTKEKPLRVKQGRSYMIQSRKRSLGANAVCVEIQEEPESWLATFVLDRQEPIEYLANDSSHGYSDSYVRSLRPKGPDGKSEDNFIPPRAVVDRYAEENRERFNVSLEVVQAQNPALYMRRRIEAKGSVRKAA